MQRNDDSDNWRSCSVSRTPRRDTECKSRGEHVYTRPLDTVNEFADATRNVCTFEHVVQLNRLTPFIWLIFLFGILWRKITVIVHSHWQAVSCREKWRTSCTSRAIMEAVYGRRKSRTAQAAISYDILIFRCLTGCGFIARESTQKESTEGNL